MWNPFKRKVPKSFEMDAVMRPFKPVIPGQWRTGMWVVLDGKVGILHKFVDSLVEVHLVDVTTGHTTLITTVALQAIRQARYTEIPECRRDAFPPDLAKEYGYGD